MSSTALASMQHGDFTQVLQTYIAYSLVVVVGLSWNAAFQNLFKRLPGLSHWGPFVYAIAVTVLAFVALFVVRKGIATTERLGHALLHTDHRVRRG